MERTAIIGTGNLAWYIAGQLDAAGYRCYVAGTDIQKAEVFAGSFKNFTAVRAEEMPETDRLILCVPDNQISLCAERYAGKTGLLIHTSGTAGMEALGGIKHGAVMWPMQSFTKGRELTDKGFYVFIQAAGAEALENTRRLATVLSVNITESTDEQRRMLHVASVFAANFTNYVLAEAESITAEAGYTKQVLMPLVREVVAKAGAMDIHEAQTGPARRGDTGTMQKHLLILENIKRLQPIYRLLSNAIAGRYGKSGI